MLRDNHLPQDYFNSFILEENGLLYTKSTGALRVFKLMGLPWSLLYALVVIPPFLRNWMYRLISENRYTWFGKKESCWLPRPEWNNRFLP
jgi:predicted DCC family thiol-disulfide oxidoreductase YuxK